MIFQDPMTSLNPVLTVGDQIREACRLHHGTGARRQPAGAAIELLDAGRDSRAPGSGSTTTRTSSRAECGSG